MFKWIALGLFTATPAMATPVRYLCRMETNTGILPARLTLDEGFKVASVGLPSVSYQAVRPALFTDSQVIVADDPWTWHFDRKSMIARREIMVDITLVSDIGQCAIDNSAAPPAKPAR